MAKKYIVAIDYGTSMSGYAFAQYRETVATKGRDLTKIYLDSDWELSGGKDYSITATDNSGEPCAWGSCVMRPDMNDYYHHSRVKMDLYDIESNIKERIPVHRSGEKELEQTYREIGGRKVFTIDLVAYVLNELKNRALKRMQEKYDEKNISIEDIQWVLTIPAHNTNVYTKQFMLNAAVKAGLVSNINSDSVWLAQEPQMAALKIHYDRELLIENDHIKFIVDAGGGTVDIAAYKCINGKPKLDEVAFSSASNSGSTYIDQEIFQYLEDLFKDLFIDYLNEYGKLNIINSIMNMKATTKMGDDACLNIGDFRDYLAENQGIERLKNTPGYRRGILVIPREKYESWIKKQFDSSWVVIQPMLDQIRSENPNTSIFGFVVGGLGCNEYFEYLVKEKCGSKVERWIHLQTRDKKISVLQGAVVFGDDPELISTRYSRFTIGEDVAVKYDSNNPKHKQRQLFEGCDGVIYVVNAFSPIFKFGEKLEESKCAIKRSNILYDTKPEVGSKKQMTFNFYLIDDNHIPEFCDYRNSRKVKDITIPYTVAWEGDLFTFNYDMSKELLKVTIIEESTGKVHGPFNILDFEPKDFQIGR